MKCGKEGNDCMIDVSDENLKVQIDVYDKRLQLKERRIKEQAIVTLRRMSSCDEVRIKSSKGLEVFVSDCMQVVDCDEAADEGDGGSCSISLWMVNYSTALYIKGPPLAVRKMVSFFSRKGDHVDSLVDGGCNGINSNNKISKILTPVKSKSFIQKRRYDLTSKERSGLTPELKMRNSSLALNDSNHNHDDHNKENQLSQRQRLGRQINANQELISMVDKSSSSKRSDRPSLTSMQNKVIQVCRSGKNVFCTGGAGTGKTTLLLALIDALVEMHGKSSVFVTATTGLAACSIGGTTVHQFAGIKASIEDHADPSLLKQQLDKVVKQACSSHNVLKRCRDAKVLLVDEVSMLSPSLLEVL